MQNIWLYRYSAFLAACTLFLVMAGATVTSKEAGLSVPDWPLSYGQVMPPMTGNIFYEHGHRMVATTVGFLTIILAVWMWRAEPRRWLRRLSLAALGAVILQGVLGGMTVLYMLPKAVSISHACLAQLFFSTTVAIALFTSPAWRNSASMIEAEHHSLRLRTLSVVAPLAVLGQLALGAAYRHKAIDLVWHVVGAGLVTGVILFVSIFTLLQYPAHKPVRGAAVSLLAITFCQVFLGVAAYMSRVATAEAPQPMPVMVWFTVAHVAVGALTMAASVIFAIIIRRHVQAAQPDAQPSPRAMVTA